MKKILFCLLFLTTLSYSQSNCTVSDTTTLYAIIKGDYYFNNITSEYDHIGRVCGIYYDLSKPNENYFLIIYHGKEYCINIDKVEIKKDNHDSCKDYYDNISNMSNYQYKMFFDYNKLLGNFEQRCEFN
jgi:hypothetical protein